MVKRNKMEYPETMVKMVQFKEMMVTMEILERLVFKVNTYIEFSYFKTMNLLATVKLKARKSILSNGNILT